MKYAYWLENIKNIGNRKKIELIKCFGTEKEIYKATKKEWKECAPFLTQANLEEMENSRKMWELNREWEGFREKQIKFTCFSKEAYPIKLKNIPDAPYGIYYKGKLPRAEQFSVAIIGARNCSEYGRYLAKEFGQALSSAGIQVISGMARGIDGISQSAALSEKGKSYAVLGCGVDICYPSQNQDLYKRLIQEGGIISEYAPKTEPKAQLFPPRNRIISGLSDAVLVIEAKERSGTLITVDMALEQGRDIYAVPGRITDTLSFGCNHLIEQGAGIVLSPENLLQKIAEQYEVKLNSERQQEENTIRSFLTLSAEELIIYSVLDLELKPVGQIYQESLLQLQTMTLSQVGEGLIGLCSKGLIEQANGGYHIKERKMEIFS